jgi:hypothetical protein
VRTKSIERDERDQSNPGKFQPRSGGMGNPARQRRATTGKKTTESRRDGTCS